MLGHARSRILLQREDYAQGRRFLEARLAEITSDQIVMSRGAEISTYLYCLASEGRLDSKSNLLDMLLADCERLRGRYSGDYPIEVLARLYRYLGREDDALRVAREHLRHRDANFKRPILPFQRELRRAADGLPAS
jgi:hypothetical protein